MSLQQILRAWTRARKTHRDVTWRERNAAPEGGDWPQRVVYLSPDSERPTGGVKIFYQHVEALRKLGVDANVMHEARGFRCRWFASSAPVLCQDDLRPGDFAVVPEVMPHAALRLRTRGVPYAMFVQNGYLVLEVGSIDDVRSAYEGAVAALAISDDTLDLLQRLLPGAQVPMIRVRHSVDATRFRPADKQMLATYMPRKMAQHARLVCGWLAMAHPNWRFQALDGLSEAQVAEALGRSRVFLAFSEYEGLPLPPIEAALAGNIVIGYPGWGALEYWRRPLFHGVGFGDVRAFVQSFGEAASNLSAMASDTAVARAALAQVFGAEAERELLVAAARRLNWLPAEATVGPVNAFAQECVKSTGVTE